MADTNKFIEETTFVKDRIEKMQNFRKESKTEERWKRADKMMKIEPLKGNFEKNFRNTKTTLRSDDWQSDNKNLTPWMKVHIALSVLGEQNPKANFKTNRRDLAKLAPFHAKLYNWSLNEEMFKYKFKRFIYNQAKYGVAFSCTKPRVLSRMVNDLVEVTKDGKEKYKKKPDTMFYGPNFRILENKNVWWDEATEVFDPWTMRDWCYLDYFSKDQIQHFFPKFKDFDKLDKSDDKERKDLYKLYFYENQFEDLAAVYSSERVIDAFPIPNDHHRLSLNYAPWFLRDGRSLDGIGIPEILMQDSNLLDKVRNMTVDQTLLSIYKTFFYDGTNEEDGVLIVQPGRGQAVLDPTKTKFMDVPGPGSDGYKREELIENSMDALTFDRSLGGVPLSGKTAFEVEQIKNASIRRLASPMDGLKFALATDAKNRMDIIHSITTDTQIEEIFDPQVAQEVMELYKDNPEVLKWDAEHAVLYRYKYREIPLKLKHEKNEFIESDEESWFNLTPEGTRFEGDVEIDVSEVLIKTPELEKQQLLELNNLMIPLLAGDPAVNKKPVMMLLKKYDQDPNDWLPDTWLQENPEPAVPQEGDEVRTRESDKLVPKGKVGGAKSVVKKLGRLMSKINPKIK